MWTLCVRWELCHCWATWMYQHRCGGWRVFPPESFIWRRRRPKGGQIHEPALLRRCCHAGPHLRRWFMGQPAVYTVIARETGSMRSAAWLPIRHGPGGVWMRRAASDFWGVQQVYALQYCVSPAFTRRIERGARHVPDYSKARLFCSRMTMYIPTTFMRMIWREPVLRRCGRGVHKESTTSTTIPN